MASIRDRLLPGTFKGVEFLVITENKQAGRKTVKHEYVSSDKRFVEDLGKQLPDYNVQAILDTSGNNDYFVVKAQFEKVLDSFGSGILQLPTTGQITAQVTNYGVVETQTELGIIKYSINFSQTDDIIIPSAISNPIGDAQINYDLGFANISTAIADNFSVSTSDNFLKAKDSLLGFSSSISDAVDRFNSTADNVSQANTLITTFEEQINSLITAPNLLGSAMVKLYADINNLSGSISDSLTGAFSTFDYDPGATDPVETSATVEANNNINTLNVNNQAMAILTIYNLAVQDTYSNVQELDNIKNNIEVFYESIINEDVDRNVIDSINDIRINFEQFYSEQSIILPNLEEITVTNILASKLSYNLYGDSSFADTLLSINNVLTTTYLEGDILVLTEVN